MKKPMLKNKYLYQILIVILLITITFFSSCSRYCANNYPCQIITKDSVIIIQNEVTNFDTMYKYIPVDSNTIKGEVYCDSNLKVIFKPIYYKDRKKEISLEVENGNLIYKIKTFKDSLMYLNRSIIKTLIQKDSEIRTLSEKQQKLAYKDYLLYFILLLLLIIVLFQCLRR